MVARLCRVWPVLQPRWNRARWTRSAQLGSTRLRHSEPELQSEQTSSQPESPGSNGMLYGRGARHRSWNH